ETGSPGASGSLAEGVTGQSIASGPPSGGEAEPSVASTSGPAGGSDLCEESRRPGEAVPPGRTPRPDCPPRGKRWRRAGLEAPLPPGRESVEDPLWAGGAAATYTDPAARRHGLDIRGHDGLLPAGADLSVTEAFVVGASLSGEFSRFDEFDGLSRVDTTGV